MTRHHTPSIPAPLRVGIVIRVGEDMCEIADATQTFPARYARNFPSPRRERIFPGHLAAVATAPDGTEAVIWRWYDAVVLGPDSDMLRMWEPAHGEILAQPRIPEQQPRTGARAYLSAGLPGADWWVAGPVTTDPADAQVELDEVERLYTEHDLWDPLT